jgi:hypothetical protein
MNREAIQSALFALLTGNATGLTALRIASRRLKPPQDVGAGNCPALFQIYKGGLARRVTINGRIETDEGLLGEYAYAIVPVEILVP